MKRSLRTAGCAVAALVLTAGAAIVAAIWLMFAEGSTVGRRLGFFDAVFVEVRRGPGGSSQLGAGLNDPLPLVITFIVATLILVAVLAGCDRLVARRTQPSAGAR
ncbi:hypothetical protein [Microbacterium oxydans]|uniref:Uncharacterized protein n=1 Tax=Microbacterium oxydans TaxID=82380 RepID=A0A0F0LKD4_9MICO|nr:hypothetical protein [Microbacterium oxydans]KJL33608.1 hypothetical protein RS83_00075 [Microbacterium oxydans]